MLIEEDLVIPKVEGKINVETPAGLVKALYKKKDNKVISVKFNNVASFLAVSNLNVQSDFLGKLKVDVAYGGNFYAIVDIQSNFKGIEYYSASDLISFGRDLRIKINNLQNFVHPLDENIKMCTHVLWSGKSSSDKLCSSNAVFYGEKAIDRSPCGTGTSARLAQKYFKGELTLGQKFIHKVIEKIKLLKKIKEEKNYNYDIEVDGGINFDNSKEVINAGANILVSGTTIFKENNGNIKKNIETLRSM